MEKLTGFLLLLATLNFALARDIPTYFRDGGELTLDLRPRPPERLTSIVWRYRRHLVAEWIKDQVTGQELVPLTYYRSFIGRTTLDVTTGRLVISNMTKADMGEYSVEVNNKVQNEKYNAVWIQEVPQPEVWIRPLTCSPDSDSCTLICDGNITDAGPVIYSWKKDGGAWEVSVKDLDITKSGTSDVKTFTCRIQNPVSERDSEPKDNPLLEKEPGSSGVGGVVGGVFGAIIVAGGVVVGAAYLYNKKRSRIRRERPLFRTNNNHKFDEAKPLLLKLP